MFEAAVKQPQCLVWVWVFRSAGFHFGIICQVMRSLPKLIKAVDDEINMGINKHLYNPLDSDTWQLIQNNSYKPVPRMELKILNDMKRTNPLSEKNASPMSVPAFRLKGLRFGRFDRRFLGTLIPNCWLKRVIASNMEPFYMKPRHLERLWGLTEKFLLESRL